MAGTKIGGQKAAQKNLAKNPLFYKIIGSRGGKNGIGHTWAHGKTDPAECGRKGGKISRRRKAVK